MGPRGRFGQVRKISPPPGFDPRTIQPVASRYKDYNTGPLLLQKCNKIFCSGYRIWDVALNKTDCTSLDKSFRSSDCGNGERQKLL